MTNEAKSWYGTMDCWRPKMPRWHDTAAGWSLRRDGRGVFVDTDQGYWILTPDEADEVARVLVQVAASVRDREGRE